MSEAKRFIDPDNIAAKIYQAKTLIDGARTYIEYHFLDADYGSAQALVKYNAEHIQVFLGLVNSLLGEAEEEAGALGQQRGESR